MPPSTSPRRSSAARTERAASPAGWIGAAALHAGIIAATLFSWSHSLDIADQSSPIVPVDLVTIGAKTNIAPMVKVQPKEPPKEEAQPPVPDQAQQALATPQQQEAAAPPPPQAASSEPIPQKPAPVTPKTKPQPEPKKDKFDLDAVSALLNKAAPMASSSKARVGSRTIKGIGDQNQLTADLNATLSSMIYKCWSPPIGAPNADQLVVVFHVFLNQNGAIAQPPELVRSAGNNSYGRAADEAARRAIYTCQPYSLPQERYAQWSDANVMFDPKTLAGQ